MQSHMENQLKIIFNYMMNEDFEKIFDVFEVMFMEFKTSLTEDIQLNSDKLKYFLIFFKVDIKLANYQRDSGVSNKSLNLFTSYFLSDEFPIAKFKKSVVNDMIDRLIIANLNFFKPVNSRLLYEKFKNNFNNKKKIKLFCKILKQKTGELNFESEVMPALLKFKKEIKRFESKELEEVNEEVRGKILKKKRSYMIDVLTLRNSLKVEVPHLLDVYRKEIISSKDSLNFHIIPLIKKAAKTEELTNDVENWLSLVNKNVMTDNQRKDYNKILKTVRLMKGLSSNKVELELEKESEEIAGMQRNFSQMIVNKDITREEAYNYGIYLEGILEELIRQENDLKILSKRVAQYFQIKREARPLKYWRQFENNLNKIESVKKSNTAFFFVNDYSLVNGSMALPFLLEAKKRGYYCIPTSPRTFHFNKSEDEWLNELAGSMNGSRDVRLDSQEKLTYNWKIDLENKKIVAHGYNIYQPIFEFISRYQFSYFLNYETNAWARNQVHLLIRTFDRVFQYCEEVYEWAKKRKIKVRFISNSPHIHRAAAYRIFCETKDDQANISYICIASGYDNYFNNVGEAKTETLAALNLTKNPNSRHSFLGTKEGFKKYYRDNIYRIEEIREKTSEWFSYHRSHLHSKVDSKKKNEIIGLIKSYKTQNKKVYLLNGKVIFDIGVKYTKGLAHNDMCDWLTDTVEAIKENPDALLLIKPHPHEQRKDLTMTDDKIDCLRDLIKTELGHNTLYLDNNMFKIEELIQYIDLGILWNGTSCLELAAQGIKTLVTDVWGHYDYPIGFIKFNSRKKYHKILKNPDKFKQKRKLKDKASVFLEYMGSDSVRIKNPYTETTSLNYHQFTATKIFDDTIDSYIKNGDEALERLMDTLL